MFVTTTDRFWPDTVENTTGAYHLVNHTRRLIDSQTRLQLHLLIVEVLGSQTRHQDVLIRKLVHFNRRLEKLNGTEICFTSHGRGLKPKPLAPMSNAQSTHYATAP